MISALEKKASLGDIDKLREQFNRNLASIRQSNQEVLTPEELNPSAHKPASPDKSESNKTLTNSTTAVLPSTAVIATYKEMFSKDVFDLTQRFELLNRHFKDLEVFCDNFVPRSEVEEAMHALFQEVKNIKMNGVTHTMFKDGLRLKADAHELERLVQSLTSAVGELNTLGEASALHQKCLVCDKPVSSLSKYRHPNQIGFDKTEEVPEHDRPGTSSADKVGSPGRTMSSKDKVRISTDLAVVRNTIDLPPIQVSSMVMNVWICLINSSSCILGCGKC